MSRVRKLLLSSILGLATLFAGLASTQEAHALTYVDAHGRVVYYHQGWIYTVYYLDVHGHWVAQYATTDQHGAVAYQRSLWARGITTYLHWKSY